MSNQYDLYLQRHRANVHKGVEWFRENIPEILPDGIDWQTQFAHDVSKNEQDEYEAYDRYFYGNNKSYKVVQDFRKAWLLHIHRNPHHWQYWVLINDDPEEGEIVLDMPYNYIIEMICDWWAFSWESGNLNEIFDWYNEHKDYIKFSSKTREIVESILDKMRKKLSENTEFFHYGVKGQKWGVKNGPPYPIDRTKKHDTIVEDAIRSGEVSRKINPDKQRRHTQNDHIPGRSYLNGGIEYAQELVDRYSGTGEALSINDKWLHKERIVSSEIIGVYVDSNGIETESNIAMIHYSKTGSHIYPIRKGNNNET